MVICPVCNTKLRDTQKSCPQCGFSDLRTEFLNSDEAVYWQTKIVEPYKKKYVKSVDIKVPTIVTPKKTKRKVLPIIDGKIIFGKYYHFNEGKKEPISWLVIKETEEKMLLLSEKCIDVFSFYNVQNTYGQECFTWFNSDLRYWLNNEFYNVAFSEKERESIYAYEFEETGSYMNRANSYRRETYSYNVIDKVFALSKKEVPLSAKISQAEPTEYAKTKGLKVYNPNKYSYWWLRDAGYSYASVVRPGGEVDERGYPVNAGFGTSMFSFSPENNKIGVRPAIWIKK